MVKDATADYSDEAMRRSPSPRLLPCRKSEFLLAIPGGILASLCVQICDSEKLNQKKFKL